MAFQAVCFPFRIAPLIEGPPTAVMWNLPPPPNFQGLHPDKELQCYQRHLPHWRQDGATYFVTFRLGDSLPQPKLQELEGLRKEWERRNPPPRSKDVMERYAREFVERVERWLDQGFGSCLLREPRRAAHLVQALHHFDIPSDCELHSEAAGRPAVEPRYELGCYVVMPNHVHAIVRPLDGEVQPLEGIVGSWKQYSSLRINRADGTQGELWQDEAFDRIIRDEEHLWRSIQYIGRNPVRAKLAATEHVLWVRPEWEAAGWTFESRRS